MLAGMFGSNEDEMRKSFLSDIKNFFGSITYKGTGAGGLSAQANAML